MNSKLTILIFHRILHCLLKMVPSSLQRQPFSDEVFNGAKADIPPLKQPVNHMRSQQLTKKNNRMIQSIHNGQSRAYKIRPIFFSHSRINFTRTYKGPY